MDLSVMKAQKYLLVLMLAAVSGAASGQNLQKHYWKLGLLAAMPANGYSGCDYKVSVGGVSLAREWQKGAHFALLTDVNLLYFSGSTNNPERTHKNFKYADISLAGRAYTRWKGFVQGQAGLGSWGPVVKAVGGWQYKKLEAALAYRYAVPMHAAECYQYANEAHIMINFCFLF
jgi:hypothetical protein